MEIILFLLFSLSFGENDYCALSQDSLKRALFAQKITTEEVWNLKAAAYWRDDKGKIEWNNYIKSSTRGTSAGSSRINNYLLK